MNVWILIAGYLSYDVVYFHVNAVGILMRREKRVLWRVEKDQQKKKKKRKRVTVMLNG